MPKTIVGLSELAAFFGVSARTISRWILKGILPPPAQHTLGRRGRPKPVWNKSDLREIVDRMCLKSV